MTPEGLTVPLLKLDLIQTLAIAALLYYAGVMIRRKVPLFDRLNIPSAVIGGLSFSLLVLLTRDRIINFQFETSTQSLFMVAFFTTIGMNASFPLLRSGGMKVVIFLAMSSLFCILQNVVGMVIAQGMGVHPLLGVMAGSVTLVGGPATGLAFAPSFRDAGLVGADVLAITAATFGIICGGIAGGPAGTWLIERFSLHSRLTASRKELDRELESESRLVTIDIDREDSSLVVNMISIATAMGIGSIVSYYVQQAGWTLPAYIGAMAVASVFRNVDDRYKLFHIDTKSMELIGGISLNIFLVVALMTLKLWELAQLALPLAVILIVQTIVVVLFALTAGFRIMGRNYDSAVMASGFIGFVLGTTANAIANMRTIVGKYGPSPTAFLVVPMVGAFFIDFVNAFIITWFLNLLR
jgi:ESS family glutamate:Na+ symporter